MIREFEGKTEEEAINKAIEELHIEREDFDVEVIDNGRRGMFKKANVKIRVKVDSCFEEDEEPFFDDAEEYEDEQEEETLEADKKLEDKVCSFIDGLISHMGHEAKITVKERKGRKVYIFIESESSNILIGRRGKNLDAIQLLANVYSGRFDAERKFVLDCEGYRDRHDERIVKEAYRVARLVKKSGRSKLLEPMNPYERRLIHKALNDVTGIETKSEGEGLYKQVRVICKKRYR